MQQLTNMLHSHGHSPAQLLDGGVCLVWSVEMWWDSSSRSPGARACVRGGVEGRCRVPAPERSSTDPER